MTFIIIHSYVVFALISCHVVY